MLLSRFNREMTQNQCFVQIGADRIEKILTKSQIATLREEWSINLAKMNTTTNEQEVGDLANHQNRMPKKRLLKYLGNTEDESETDPIDYSNFKRETSSEDASSSFLDGLVASAASNSPPSLVSTTGLNLTSSAVAVVKPTISAPENTLGSPEEDPFLNTEFEKKPLIGDHTVDVSLQGKASVGAVATETTESSPFSAHLPLVSPPDTKSTVSSLTSKVVPPAKFSDGPPPLTGVPNGVHTSITTSTSSSPIPTATGSIRVRPQYELEEECIEDKVTVIHTKKRMLPTQRRLSECSTEQKRPQSDPNPVTEMAKVTVVSKRAASTESAEQPLSPKGASQMPKRRKRELEEVYNHHETVGTVSRICQELPRCNWLEEKILKTSTPTKEEGKASPENILPEPTSSIPWPSATAAAVSTDTFNSISPDQPRTNVSRVYPVKKAQISPPLNAVGFESARRGSSGNIDAGNAVQIPELITDEKVIQKSAFLPTTSNSTEADIRVEKPEVKPKVNREALKLNGNNSVESEELPDSPPFNKYEYMSKNLTQRLNQMSSNPTIGEETLMRHDLFEIDRKRKLVAEELEALQRRRHEEFEAMKLLQERKNDLLKELNELQKCIEKEKGFMRQLEKEILAKSRIANVPVPDFMRARLEEQEWESGSQHNKPQQHQQQNHEQQRQQQQQQQQLDREVQHLKSTHHEQHQPQQPDVLQHLTPQQQIQQLQQQKELQQLQHQKDIQQLREQQRQKELLQQRQQQEKIKQQQIHHQRQQQLQAQQQQQQKMQRIAPKSMDSLQQQQQQQGYGYPSYNQLPPPPPLGHMGRGPYRHGGVAPRPPPPPQSYLHFQGHPRHQALMEGNNGASAQPPPQLHQARQHQQQIHHKQPQPQGGHPTHLYTQQQRAAVAEQYNKLHGYGGQVPPAVRQPLSYAPAPITRQPNTSWMPQPAEYQRVNAAPAPQTLSRPNSVSTHHSAAATNSGSPVAARGYAERPRSAIEHQASAGSAAAVAVAAAAANSQNKVVVMDIFCKNCRQEANFMCSACKSVHYCSLECQKNHWIHHSKFCTPKAAASQ